MGGGGGRWEVGVGGGRWEVGGWKDGRMDGEEADEGEGKGVREEGGEEGRDAGNVVEIRYFSHVICVLRMTRLDLTFFYFIYY